jgi:hypothetical protein
MLWNRQAMSWLGLSLFAAAAVATQGYFGTQGASPSGAVDATYLEDLAGVRTGPVSPQQRLANTAAINRLLGAGAVLRMRAGTRIEIARSLTIGSGGGIIGDATGPKPVIYMPAAAFNNRNDVAGEGRYGPNAVGINFSGELSGRFRPANGVRLENLNLQSQQRPGRRLRGIVGQNVTNCSVRNVEISGLPLGVGLALASARGCRVNDVYVHDFADTTPWELLPQSTGIEIDNDIINRVPSSNTSIQRFRIERLLVSGPLLAKWGYQTDGINVMTPGSRVHISDGHISDVGEGIDTFGSDGTITNVRVNNAYIFGLKFVHGASRNIVRNVTITNAGLAGVNFAGSDQSAQDIVGNVITGLKIVNIDPQGMWKENSTAGILVSGRNARRVPIGNRVIGADIDLGPNGKYGWIDQSTGRGNTGSDIAVRGGRALDRKVLILYGGGSAGLRSGTD